MVTVSVVCALRNAGFCFLYTWLAIFSLSTLLLLNFSSPYIFQLFFSTSRAYSLFATNQPSWSRATRSRSNTQVQCWSHLWLLFFFVSHIDSLKQFTWIPLESLPPVPTVSSLNSGSYLLIPDVHRGFPLHSIHSCQEDLSKCCFYHCVTPSQIFNGSSLFSSTYLFALH